MVTLNYRGELTSVARGSEAGPSSEHKVSLGLDISISTKPYVVVSDHVLGSG